jgi:hypothetical protein
MNVVEEIKEIKALLDEGKISEEEFQARKRNILNNTGTEDRPPEVNLQSPPTENKEQDSQSGTDSGQAKLSVDQDEANTEVMSSTKEMVQISPDHVVAAGRGIQSSVKFLVISYIMTFSGIVLFLYSLVFEILSGIMHGDSLGEIYGDSGALIIGSLLMLLGIIFWIKYVLRLNKAGRLLKGSSEVSGDTVKEIRKKMPRAERKPNPVAIITAVIAALSVLFPFILHFRMALGGVPVNMVMGLVAIAGGIMAFNNLRWSFLPGAINVFMGIITLILRFRYFEPDYARQFLISVLPVPVVFITASVIFIIFTVKYLKTPRDPKYQ